MQNLIAATKGLLIAPENKGGSRNEQLAASLQAELMNLGFMLDEDAFKAASRESRDWIIKYHGEVVPELAKRIGADRDYRPFYVNFPQQVMGMSEIELFCNAFFHYLSNGKWEPSQELKDRGMAFEHVDAFKVIRLGTKADLDAVFSRMLGLSQSLSGGDKDALVWYLRNCDVVLPKSIPFKETLCLVASVKPEGKPRYQVPVKMVTDVLRVAVAMSGGDISLPAVPKMTIYTVRDGRMRWFYENTKAAQEAARAAFKFAKFNRPDRQFLLGLMENTNLDLGELSLDP